MDASPRQAAELLDELAVLRGRTRRSLGVPWFPMVCFGALGMLAAAPAAVWGAVALGPFWLVGGIVGMLLVRRHYRARIDRSGVSGRGRRVWAVGLGMFGLCLVVGTVAGSVSGRAAAIVAPVVVVAVGYAVIGALQRSWLPPLAVAPAVVASIGLAAAGGPPWSVELVLGGGLLVAGLATRAIGRHR